MRLKKPQILAATGSGIFLLLAGVWFFQGSLNPCTILKRHSLLQVNEAVSASGVDVVAGEMALGVLEYKITQLTNDMMSPAECLSSLVESWRDNKKALPKAKAEIKKGVAVDAEVLFDGKDPAAAKDLPTPIGKSIDAEAIFKD